MSNNFINHAAAAPCEVPTCEQLGEQDRLAGRIRLVNKQLAGLFTGYSPAFGNRVTEILDHSPPTDQAMLDAWARIGHQDAHRGPRIDLIQANESTMSAMGVACLISYARGYLDELETIQAATVAAVAPPPPAGPDVKAQTSAEDPHPNPKPRPAKRPRIPTGQTCQPSHCPPSPAACGSASRSARSKS